MISVEGLALPESWKNCKAQDIIDVRDGTHDSPKYISSGYPLVTSKNLIDGEIDFANCSYISESDHTAISKRSAVHDGDILYAMIGTIGNPVIVKKEFEFSIKNVALLKFTKSDVLNRYIYYYLQSDFTKRQFDSRSRGGTQKFVSLTNIRELKIPLPPLAEQQKIAAILDAADQLRQKDQQLIDHYTALSQSLFLEMFGDPVSNPKGWEKLKVVELCSEIVDCVNKTAPVVSFKTDYKMIRTTNVRNYKVDLSTVKYVEQESYDKWVRRLIPERGDVIFTREAPVGEAGILESDEKVFLGQRLMEYRANPQLMNPYYMLYELMGENIKRQIVKLSSGSTVKHLAVPDCQKFLLNTPPIELQNQFSDNLKVIEKQKKQAQTNLQNSESLFNSLLQRAFKGKLTSIKAA